MEAAEESLLSGLAHNQDRCRKVEKLAGIYANRKETGSFLSLLMKLSMKEKIVIVKTVNQEDQLLRLLLTQMEQVGTIPEYVATKSLTHMQSLYDAILWNPDATELMVNAYFENFQTVVPEHQIQFPCLASTCKPSDYFAAKTAHLAHFGNSSILKESLLFRQLNAFIYMPVITLSAAIMLFGIDALVPILPLIKDRVGERFVWQNFDEKHALARLYSVKCKIVKTK
jgi:hypothetical protein